MTEDTIGTVKAAEIIGTHKNSVVRMLNTAGIHEVRRVGRARVYDLATIERFALDRRKRKRASGLRTAYDHPTAETRAAKRKRDAALQMIRRFRMKET